MDGFKQEITFFFTESEGDNEVKNIHLSAEAPYGLHLAYLHRMCKSFAYTIGFSNKSIEEFFGESRYDDLEEGV